MSERVVVVGGGVVGACSAYYLAKAGLRVTVLDRGKFGAGCSHANCGYVCPSHVLPLAAPGAVWSTLKTLFQRNSPLKVRPRHGAARTSAGSSASPAGATSATCSPPGRAIQALLNSSRVAVRRADPRPSASTASGRRRGCCSCSRRRRHFDHYAHTDELLRREFAMPAKRFDADALAALEPALKPGHGRRLPVRVRRPPAAGPADERAAARARSSSGVDDPRELRGDRRSRGNGDGEGGGRAAAGDEIRGRSLRGRHRGVDAAAQPRTRLPRPDPAGEGLLDHDAAAGALPDVPADLRGAPRRGHAVRIGLPARLDDGVRRATTTRSNRSRLSILTEAAKLYLREPLAEPVQEEWWGWRPMTFDGLPIIDRARPRRTC